jgi:hypothetical protein
MTKKVVEAKNLKPQTSNLTDEEQQRKAHERGGT